MAEKSELVLEDGKSDKHLPSLTKDDTDNPHFHPMSKKFRKLPPWLDHFNSRDLKTLTKCFIAVWAYTLLIVIDPTLRALGQATFFGVIVLIILPPSGVVFIALMGGLTLVIGMCLGWAWGTITMKAALATRPAADLNARYAELQQEATQNTTNVEQASGQATFTQVAIFNGFMLDTRVSITYFCMMGLFIYLMSRARAKAPKLALLTLFAIIVSDIYITTAPLIPQFQGTLASTFLKPSGVAIGVGFVCNVLIFPKSTSHFALHSMQDLLTPMASFLEACQLNLQNPNLRMDMDRLKETKSKIIQTYEELQQSLGFLKMDASVGRWNADDVQSLQKPLRQVLATCAALLQVQVAREDYRLKDEQLVALYQKEETDSSSKVKAGRHHLTEAFDFRQRTKNSEGENLRNQSLLALSSSGQSVFDACQNSIIQIQNALHNCNTRRWFGRPSPENLAQELSSHRASLTELRKHNQEFSMQTAEPLWNLHAHYFDENGHLVPEMSNGMPATGLVLALVLEEALHNFTCAVEDLLKEIVALEEKRTKTHLWLPGNLQNLASWATDDESLTLTKIATSVTPSAEKSDKRKQTLLSRIKAKRAEKNAKKTEETAASQLASMTAHGTRTRNKTGQMLVGLVNWFSNDEGMYALRVLVVTIALGCPAVIPSSAGFYYREKGLWALIMAQMGLATYTAEFTVGLILRLVATVIGGAVGLAAWYIGAGNGPGNPYGIAAIMAPIVLAIVWGRLFLPPSTIQVVMIFAATCYLVVSYSWVDTHIPSYGNPGVGYPVFWRRVLLVIVGFSAAAVVTLFPRPPSANKHYRHLLSESLGTIQNQYSLLLLNCQSQTQNKSVPSDLRDVAEETAIANAKLLLSVEPQLKSLRFEYSSSNFDTKSLERICRLCQTLNNSVAQLLYYVPYLDNDKVRSRFLFISNLLDDKLAGDVMAVLSLVQSTLISGAPLPTILPCPLHVRTLETARSQAVTTGAHFAGGQYEVVLSKELLAEKGARRYCSAMSAYVQVLRCIDELVVITKLAVGETGVFAGVGRARGEQQVVKEV